MGRHTAVFYGVVRAGLSDVGDLSEGWRNEGGALSSWGGTVEVQRQLCRVSRWEHAWHVPSVAGAD